MALTGTTHREVYMRVAIFGFLSGFALAALPLAANAVPMGPSVPAVGSAPAVELGAGGFGPRRAPPSPALPPRGNPGPPPFPAQHPPVARGAQAPLFDPPPPLKKKPPPPGCP